jgi:hypothetical protein
VNLWSFLLLVNGYLWFDISKTCKCLMGYVSKMQKLASPCSVDVCC